jgi:uncharacterized protein YjbI with pentapeptide repeats
LAGGIAALAFAFIVLCGYLLGWKWTGLPKQTLWDWLDLLIVPAVLALGGYLFARSENGRMQRIAAQRAADDRQVADQRTKEDRSIAEQRDNTDRQIAAQSRRHDMLQAYLEQIGQLLLDQYRPLRQSEEGSEVSTLARARTLTTLSGLDPGRKKNLLLFLYEAGLIGRLEIDVPERPGVEEELKHLAESDDRGADIGAGLDSIAENLEAETEFPLVLAVIDLKGANLNELDLEYVDLSGVNLGQTIMNRVNLTGAILTDEASFIGTELKNAKFNVADLTQANLSSADLTGTDLTAATLNGTVLKNATLVGANLWFAGMAGAVLDNADLTNAVLSDAQVAQCKSLKDATMPNGQKYEDWLKDKKVR